MGRAMTKRFEAEDEVFWRFRQSFTGREFTLEDLDHFTLIAGVHNFARKKFIVDLLSETLDVTGNIYEFGTWRGSTLILLAEWYKLMRPQGYKSVYAFDGFEGLASGTSMDGNAQGEHVGEYKGDAEFLQLVIQQRGLASHVNLVPGDIIETAAAHFERIALPLVSFALIDVDLFEPAKAAIDAMLPYLSPGAKVVFDEGTAPEWEGEQRAVTYLVKQAKANKLNFTLQENQITRQPTTVFTLLS